MSIRATATCDICGETAGMKPFPTGFFPPAERRPPAAWLTVKPIWPGSGITLPQVPDDRNPDPDLCSWGCVALYAARQAEEEVARAEKKVARIEAAQEAGQ